MTHITEDKLWLSGNEAIALGAYEAGITVASGYPGTPSTEILETLSTYEGVYCEWAPNEKVGLEVAIGASLAGARAMATMKHVGVNVAADPLFTASYIGVRGGLVLITADDPEMHSSQNEQDNRNYALAAKVPMIEPSDPAEAKLMMIEAVRLSEELDTPVMLRITSRVAHVKGVVAGMWRQQPPPTPALEKNPAKMVMLPAMARKRRQAVEERMIAAKALADETILNRIERGEEKRGFITGGVSYLYVKEAFPNAPVLKIGLTWPLPDKLIREFAAMVDEIVVVEELDPFIERHVKSLGIACRGQDIIPNRGELNTDILVNALTPERAERGFAALDLPPRPPNMCPGCPHRGVFHNLKRLKVFVSGDIGCYTLGALPPLSSMDASVCMGASVTVAHGMMKALGAGAHDKVVSVIGDSTFCHSGITGLVNTVYNNSAATLVILDNRITAMTGHQENPASGRTLKGEAAHQLDIEGLCRAVGVKHVFVINPHDIDASYETLKEAIALTEPSVVIAKAPCALLPAMRKRRIVPYSTRQKNCVGCMSCVRLGCPAISWTPFAAGEAERRGYKAKQKGLSKIDETMCNDCGQCAAVCKFQAISHREETK
ncbi:MAG: indolepyruvate ferredoxin oxidoreductase subunit alpha [Desulfobulbaceae bacterium]|nr:indolepyruvate ferredoxin oxidoreductase subunit alpha [Desulfobulbaceae bacterium]